MGFIHSFSLIFALANPIANALIFDSLNTDKARSWQLALKAALLFFCAAILSALIGTQLLHLFSISIDAFRSCGGVLIFLIGLSMVQNKSHPSHTHDDNPSDSFVMVPLCIPILCGPGTISSLVFLASHIQTTTEWLYLLSAVGLDALLIYVFFGLSSYVSTILGRSGGMIITRVFGIILLSMGGQMMLSGIKNFFSLP